MEQLGNFRETIESTLENLNTSNQHEINSLTTRNFQLFDNQTFLAT